MNKENRKTYIYYHRFDKSMKSYDLTLAAFLQYLKDSGNEMVVDTLTVGKAQPHNKPFFEEFPEIYHNVSHSGDYWVCAFGLVENGLDLQKNVSKNTHKIAERFFHPRETAWLMEQEKDQFFRIWAFNESYVKYKGDGLTEGLEYFSVIPEAENVADLASLEPGMKEVCQQEISFPEEDYWLVLTTKEEVEVTLLPLSLRI